MAGAIAFIGCGAMGAPMAERLLEGGFALRIFDVNEAAMRPLVERGAVPASSPRDAAAEADTAFACLPSPEVSRKVALGSDGIVGCKGLRVYVETSTIGSGAVKAIAKELGQARITVLDAPVSGGPRGARAGTLATMVAGDRATFERTRPLFDAIARNVFYIGIEPGLAQIAKLANNMISAAGMASAFEAVAMAVKAGVDARTLIDAINASTGRNTATTDKLPTSVLPRTFEYGGKLATMYKDIDLCLAEAKQLKVPMWVGSAVVQLWFQAMTEGRGEDDYTTLIQMIEKWAGVTVGGNESEPVGKR
jgi:3-hydroxyisobutyrate dehydrogenase-like beta-hydroxyacid dehydrogenase